MTAGPLCRRLGTLAGWVLCWGYSPSVVAASELALDLLVAAPPTPAAQSALVRKSLPSQTLRSRAVNLNPLALDALSTGATRIRVEFFPDAIAEVDLKPVRSHGGTGRVWSGHVSQAAQHGDFLLATHGDAVAVQYSCHGVAGAEGGRVFQIVPGENGQVAVVEQAPMALPPCGLGRDLLRTLAERKARLEANGQVVRPTSDPRSRPEPPVRLEAVPEVDVAVLWTPMAKATYGGESGVRAVIDLAIANGNTALANSLNTHRYHLVYAGEAVGYQQDFSQLTDLTRLTSLNDGSLDEAHAIRNITRADLVALVTDFASDSCGIAWLLDSLSGGGTPEYGFSVTASNCISNKTFVHEIGHNLGCLHAREDGGTGLFPYSYGLKFSGTNAQAYRTVMAYAPGTRIDNFSNPSVSFQGVPTGIDSASPLAADNARTMSESFATVQNYRTRLTGTEPPALVVGPPSYSVHYKPLSGAYQLPVVLGNSGAGSFSTTVTLNPPVTGLSLSAPAGDLLSGAPQTLILSVDTAVMPSATYSTRVEVFGNSQLATVPVEVTIDQIPNDSFANARTLPTDGGSAASTTVDAGIETGEPVPPGVTNPRTVWYQWSYTGPPVTKEVKVSSLGTEADSFVAVYTGSAVNALTTVTTSRTAFDDMGSLGTFSRFSSPGEAVFSAQAGVLYRIQVGTEAGLSSGAPVSIHLYPQARQASLPPGETFGNAGQEGTLFDTYNLGTRTLDNASGLVDLMVNPSPRTRVFGVLENADLDLPYQSVGPNRYVRAVFHVSYSGPGDSGSPTLSNLVPNFRFGLRTKAAVNAVLEVLHNTGTGDPGNRDAARELGPSRNDARPSRYKLDLDPVDVPALAGATTEGIQRSFEVIADLPDYTYVSGRLRLSESSVFTYPALDPSVAPLKIYQSGGGGGTADFDNPGVSVGILGFDRDQILRYLTGSPDPGDYFAPNVISYIIGQAGVVAVRSADNGVALSTTAVPVSRIGVAAVDFTTGNFFDRADLTDRVRTARGILHRISFRVRTDQPSDTVPYLRFRARTAKFAWSAKLELNGAKGLNTDEGRTMLAQILPGAGNAVPGPNSTTDGIWYHLMMPTPIDPWIRNDLRLTGNEPTSTLFPILANQPGPGTNAASRRDVLLGFDVIDSLSYGANSDLEAADQVRLNRIEIRQYPDLEL